jgi:hypothetical protein
MEQVLDANQFHTVVEAEPDVVAGSLFNMEVA